MNYLKKLSPAQRLLALLLCIAALAAGIYSGVLQQRAINPPLRQRRADQAFIKRSMASPMRTGPGK